MVKQMKNTFEKKIKSPPEVPHLSGAAEKLPHPFISSSLTDLPQLFPTSWYKADIDKNLKSTACNRTV